MNFPSVGLIRGIFYFYLKYCVKTWYVYLRKRFGGMSKAFLKLYKSLNWYVLDRLRGSSEKPVELKKQKKGIVLTNQGGKSEEQPVELRKQ
jgi:hypothetical protein